MRAAALLAAFLFAGGPALSALAPSVLGGVGVTLGPDASFPASLALPDIAGTRRTLSQILAGRPGFVLFADYTCKGLCGPALVLLSNAIEKSGLSPQSYRVIVLGLDPKDTPADALRMLAAEVPRSLGANVVLLRPDAATLAAAATTLGFRYAYDESVDQFAHPELVYVVAADGRINDTLSPFALVASDLTTALSASHPAPSLVQRVRLICYRFGLLSGPYTGAIETAFKAGAILTLAAFAAALFLMRRKQNTP